MQRRAPTFASTYRTCGDVDHLTFLVHVWLAANVWIEHQTASPVESWSRPKKALFARVEHCSGGVEHGLSNITKLKLGYEMAL